MNIDTPIKSLEVSSTAKELWWTRKDLERIVGKWK